MREWKPRVWGRLAFVGVYFQGLVAARLVVGHHHIYTGLRITWDHSMPCRTRPIAPRHAVLEIKDNVALFCLITSPTSQAGRVSVISYSLML